MTDIEYTPGPLLTAAQTTRTALWNDSADLDELRQSISFGGVGATCNPVIAYTVIRNHMDVWVPRILAIAEAHPTWGESEIGWQAVKDMSKEAAALLKPIFDEHNGRNGRLSVQTDPRFHRDAKALADQGKRRKRQRVQHALGDEVELTEQDGGGFRTHAQVVVAVDHRIPGVVGGGPEDIGEV